MPKVAKKTSLNKLTGRERKVVRLLLKGQLNREIAATPGLSEKTVVSRRLTSQGSKNVPSRILCTIASQYKCRQVVDECIVYYIY